MSSFELDPQPVTEPEDDATSELARQSWSAPEKRKTDSGDSGSTSETHTAGSKNKPRHSCPQPIVEEDTGKNINEILVSRLTYASPGDNLTLMSRRQLPLGSSEKEIHNYTREIARTNLLADPNSIRKDQRIVLPGKTSDGGSTRYDESGVVMTWADGTEIVNHSGAIRSVSKPDQAGGRISTHSAERKEGRFTLGQDAEGELRLNQHDGADCLTFSNTSETRAARESLIARAKEHFKTNEQLSRFQADMIRLEARIGSSALRLDASEVVETYKQLTRLFDAKKSKVEKDDRGLIAGQILSHAANPSSIDQGIFRTCNVTSVEVRTYAREPSKAAKLVVDVALTGSFSAENGPTVKIDTRKDRESVNHRTPDGARDYASQLFQVTAVNLAYQSFPDGSKANVQYKQTPFVRTAREIESDRSLLSSQSPSHFANGERLVETSSGSEKLIGNSPQLMWADIARTSHLITGKVESDVLIGIALPDNSAPGVTEIRSQQELDDLLTRLKEKKRLPAIVAVHSGLEPFKSDLYDHQESWHVVTVHDYEKEPGKEPIVHFDNQWGGGRDHLMGQSVPLAKLYLSMRHPTDTKQIGELEARAKQTGDLLDQLELTRLEAMVLANVLPASTTAPGKTAQDQLRKNLISTISGLDKDTQPAAIIKIGQILPLLTPATQVELSGLMAGKGLIPASAHTRVVRLATQKLLEVPVSILSIGWSEQQLAKITLHTLDPSFVSGLTADQGKELQDLLRTKQDDINHRREQWKEARYAVDPALNALSEIGRGLRFFKLLRRQLPETETVARVESNLETLTEQKLQEWLSLPESQRFPENNTMIKKFARTELLSVLQTLASEKRAGLAARIHEVGLFSSEDLLSVMNPPERRH